MGRSAKCPGSARRYTRGLIAADPRDQAVIISSVQSTPNNIAGGQKLVLTLRESSQEGDLSFISSVYKTLTEEGRNPKIVYIPGIGDQDTGTPSAVNIGNLIGSYIDAGHDVITNSTYHTIRPDITHVELDQTKPFIYQHDEPVHVSDKGVTSKLTILDSIHGKANITGTDLARLNPNKDFFTPVDISPKHRHEYLGYISSQVAAYYELSSQLTRAGISPSSALQVLPVSLLINGSLKNEYSSSVNNATVESIMDGHLSILPLSLGSLQPKSGKIVSANPRLETDIVKDILFSISDLESVQIDTECARMSYREKTQVLQDYIAATSGLGDALVNIRYRVELQCTAEEMLDIAMLTPSAVLVLQVLSPAGGYEVPADIVNNNLHNILEDAYDRSVAMHSTLQATYGPGMAQNACLLGHRLRSTVSFDVRELCLLLRGNWLHDSLAPSLSIKHPIISDALSQLPTN